jgi:hypothetical protein
MARAKAAIRVDLLMAESTTSWADLHVANSPIADAKELLCIAASAMQLL